VRPLICAFDALVRSLQGVFEFSEDPLCLLRLRWGRLRRPLTLNGAAYPVGTHVLEIHLWNERIPPLPPEGADVRWAAEASRRLRRSLEQAAAYVQGCEPRCGGELVTGTTILVDSGASAMLLRRLGFELRHRPAPFSLVQRLQDRYALALMSVFNPASARRRTRSSPRRTEMWMTMRQFLRRYGPMREAASIRGEYTAHHAPWTTDH
jgi:hypothetical protein